MRMIKHPTVAHFIAQKIKEGGKSQLEIAEACGWGKTPNMVTMVKQGKSRLPLEKIGPMATVLGVQPVYLFWLTMQEYLPETLKEIEFSIRGVMLTDHEKDIIEAYRDLTHGVDEDVVLNVDGDEATVRTDGSVLMYRHVPGGPKKVSLATGCPEQFRQAVRS